MTCRTITSIAVIVLLAAIPRGFAGEVGGPDFCPPEYEDADHPACPPASTLKWIDCPVKWPLDEQVPFTYSGIWEEFTSEYNLFDLTRRELEGYTRGGHQLDCHYGPPKDRYRHRLTIELPRPLIQCGWHATPQGMTIGCRVPREVVAPDPPVLHPAEPVSAAIALAGFGLRATRAEIAARADQQGFTVTEEQGAMSLSRTGTDVVVVFAAHTGLSREVILRSTQDGLMPFVRDTVLRFGFAWELQVLKPGPDPKERWWRSIDKYVWSSPDKRIVVELWPSTQPGEKETLHLIDRR